MNLSQYRVAKVMEKSGEFWNFKNFWNFWKNHGVLGWVMEKSWNLEIRAKCYGKVMEFDKRLLPFLQFGAAMQQFF